MINKREILLSCLGLMVPGSVRAADVLRLPLKRDKLGRYMLSAIINGQGPFDFCINAGSGVSTIDSIAAKQLRLQIIGDPMRPYELSESNQKIKASLVNAVDILFGSFKLRNYSFLRVSVAKMVAENTIGSRLFFNKPCILDSEAGEIRIYTQEDLPLDGFRAVRASIHTGGVRTANVIVEANLGGVSLKAAINTASCQGLVLSSAYVAAHGLWDRFADVPSIPVDANDATKGMARHVHMTDFTIASYTFSDINVYLPDLVADVEFADADCLLGGNILEQFSIAFDEKHAVWMKPNANFSGITAPALSMIWPDVPIVGPLAIFNCDTCATQPSMMPMHV